MKKFLALFIIICVSVFCVACGNTEQKSENNDNDYEYEEKVDNVDDEEETEEETEALLSKSELKKELKKQPCYVSRTEYSVQSDDYKALYPDLMIANVKNNCGSTIKSITVSFAAWDEDGLPLTITGDGFVGEVDLNGANIKDGEILKDWGAQVDEDLARPRKIKKFKAIVKRYTDYNGEEWENPLYDNWMELYDGKELN